VENAITDSTLLMELNANLVTTTVSHALISIPVSTVKMVTTRLTVFVFLTVTDLTSVMTVTLPTTVSIARASLNSVSTLT